MTKRITLFDTTLRDGGQTPGVTFSVKDKQTIAKRLDQFGVRYIEGGWPGTNSTDNDFFDALPTLNQAKFVAFGMTCGRHTEAKDDERLSFLKKAPVETVCLFGKTWDFHVSGALHVTPEENLRMIRDSVSYVRDSGKEVVFDAEHFFDGVKANEPYALSCLDAAVEGGASWLVLCDTNGGTMYYDVRSAVDKVKEALPNVKLGIHCHDDSGVSVASSMEAVRGGCTMVQGTLNGLGERCGNTNFATLLPNLRFKMGYDIGVSDEELAHLTEMSRSFATFIDRDLPPNAPYVGTSAFAHKAGVHASAIKNDPRMYEHVAPETVGNRRDVLVSNQSGLSNLRHTFGALGIRVKDNDPALGVLLAEVKEREKRGFAYDYARASFEILALETLKRMPSFFSIQGCSVFDSGMCESQGAFKMTSHASVLLHVGNTSRRSEGNGVGPVNALDAALRKGLVEIYPSLGDVQLTDYHVRILDTKKATAATTRVLLESRNVKNDSSWVTVGISPDIIYASLHALCDSYAYGILKATKAETLPVLPVATQGEKNRRINALVA